MVVKNCYQFLDDVEEIGFIANGDVAELLKISNYEDRYVIPSSHREYAGRAFDIRSSCGFSFGNGCSTGENKVDLFGKQRKANLWGGTHE